MIGYKFSFGTQDAPESIYKSEMSYESPEFAGLRAFEVWSLFFFGLNPDALIFVSEVVTDVIPIRSFERFPWEFA